MTARSPLESGLFRLCLVLKVTFWAALIAILAKVIWAAATGQEQGDPAAMAGIVGGLVLLQIAATATWWRVRRARLRAEAS